MKKIIVLILIGFFSCTEEQVEIPCDYSCVVVDNTYKVKDRNGVWYRTMVNAVRVCDGKEVSFTEGRVTVQNGTVICREEFTY